MFLILLAILVIGIAIGAYALLAPRKVAAIVPPSAAPSAAAMSEAQRVDAVFATGALESDESTAYLVAALDDPSEAVALAAAHALAGSGRSAALQAYLRNDPGARSDRLRDTVDALQQL